MISERWRYAVQVLGEDHSPLRQIPVTMDWDPLREWIRLMALRQGSTPARALLLDCSIDPIWDHNLGDPFVGGLRACALAVEGAHTLAAEFGTSFFSAAAKAAVNQLVDEGVLQAGTGVRCLPVAYARPQDSDEPLQNGRFTTQAGAPTLHIRSGSLSHCLARSASAANAHVGLDDIPVFLPQAVLHEARELASAESARETGGLLIGHLCRDVAGGDLFIEATAQLPARNVDASLHRLTFTSDTWTEFRSALALRGQGEIMIGWWHSHPVREWCKKCSEESQRACALRGDFLSEDDRLLHRTVFPRAYSLALVVNVVGYEEPTFSLFGWRQGLLELRGHHVLHAAGAAAVPA
ncbi:MAG: Mov34/MPN/PAD-1 family protein [Longimicrobiales bacterium]